jgi:thiopeptide-type bacteriocin biosynthesis protein
MTVPRRLAPGSSCLYVKLYTGTASADRLLRDVVAPIATEALVAGDASHWFFIRYSDPHNHLRVRFFGDPARLFGTVLPALHDATAPLLDDGSMWRIQVDTYDREVERYGGPAAIELVEKLFWLDSEAVIDTLGIVAGDAGADLRWQIGLRGADDLLTDLGLDDAARAGVFGNARDMLDREHRTGTDFHKQLGERFRGRKADIERVLTLTAADASAAVTADTDDPMAHAVATLVRRSERSQAFVAELRARDDAGALSPRIPELAWSLVHMHLNRLLHASQRSQELVLYDFLRRWHAGRRAQKKPGPA